MYEVAFGMYIGDKPNQEDCILVNGEIYQADELPPGAWQAMSDKPQILAVCDGMGGHSSGDWASRHVAEQLRTLDAAALLDNPDLIHREMQRIQNAMMEDPHEDSGTTVAGLIVGPGRVIAFNAGDSRVYRLEPPQSPSPGIKRLHAKRLSHDHSLVQSLLDHNEIKPGVARRHRFRNQIDFGLGAAFAQPWKLGRLKPTIAPDQIARDHHYLICTDGLTELISDHLLERKWALRDFDDLTEIYEWPNRHWRWRKEPHKKHRNDNVAFIFVRTVEFAAHLKLAAATRPTIPGIRDFEAPWCPELVAIPAGRFTMGAPEDEPGFRASEGPPHQVSIARPFLAGRYPVTFAEWDAAAAEGACNGYRPADEGWGRGRHPVINVSWDDAKAFTAWLSARTGKRYRLLTEAEWEYAARAGTTTPWPWGTDTTPIPANCAGSGSEWSNRKTAPVDAFPPNDYGLHDMLGNAWEWVADAWHAAYRGAPADGSAWTGGAAARGLAVARGGSWHSALATMRSASRIAYRRGHRTSLCGFRVARDAE